MAVVARLNVHAVEHTAFGKTYKMQPVVGADDPYNEEIKRFFAATPGGSVAIMLGKDEEELFNPGDQCYLYIDKQHHHKALPFAFKVSSIKLDGWATTVEFTVDNKSGGAPYNGSKMSFSIRNETAAEEFHVGNIVYVQLAPVPNAS